MDRRRVAYRELAEQLRRSIRHGEFADGSPLPTEHALAETHAVSRQTVRRAMQELVTEGLVYRVAGRGTFAVDEPRPYVRSIGSIADLMGLSSDTELRVARPLRMAAVPEQADRLGVSGRVATIGFTRQHDGAPFSFTSVFLPADVAHLLADVPSLRRKGARAADTVIGLIDQRMPRPITQADQMITAAAPPEEVQRELGVGAGDPVLLVERLYRDAVGRAVELAISHFLPEHYEYRVTLRRDPR